MPKRPSHYSATVLAHALTLICACVCMKSLKVGRWGCSWQFRRSKRAPIWKPPSRISRPVPVIFRVISSISWSPACRQNRSNSLPASPCWKSFILHSAPRLPVMSGQGRCCMSYALRRQSSPKGSTATGFASIPWPESFCRTVFTTSRRRNGRPFMSGPRTGWRRMPISRRQRGNTCWPGRPARAT
ncbi:hypothetical protein D3C86_988800 [compost metagenome]